MAKPARKHQSKQKVAELKGWKEIAAFLGQPASVVQRWAAEGMPLRKRGRYVTTTGKELNQWLGRESGKPVHVATDSTDLTAELQRGISFVRCERRAGSGARKSRR